MVRFIRFLVMSTLVLAMNGFNADAKSSSSKPDFAYPETVTTDSEKKLNDAVAARNYPEAVTALINLTLAQSAISADRLPGQIKRIEALRDGSEDVAFRAVLNALLARIYVDVYNSDRWKYNQRDLPLDPLPEDYTLWSGAQFKNYISSLVTSSLSDADALKTIPITDWAGPIVADRLTVIYFPTLYDFIASSAIDRLKVCLPDDWFLSFGLLTRADVYIGRRINLNSSDVNRILSLYADLLRFHEHDTAPFIRNDIARIRFLLEHVYIDTDDDRASVKTQTARVMMDLYDRFRNSEYSGDILQDIKIDNGEIAVENSVGESPLDMSDDELLFRRYYDAVVRNIEMFPAYHGLNCLKNIFNDLTRRELSVSVPRCVAPGAVVKLKVISHNVTNAHLDIYDVSSSSVADDDYRYDPSRSHKLVKSISLSFSGESPFEISRAVEFIFPSAGNYIAVPVIDGVAEKKQSYSIIHVTRLALTTSTYPESKIWVFDPLDGSPVNNASLTQYTEVRDVPITKEIGRSDSNGSLAFTTDKWCKILVSKGNDRYASPLSLWNNGGYNPDDKWLDRIQGYTSLPIYHPGDTVEWVAVAYEYKSIGNERRVKKNSPVTAVLRNASYEAVDTLNLVSDEFGRVHGSFHIPAESMTGNFNIRFGNGSISFMVSDYKLPTFQIITEKAENNIPSAGDVTLRGKVISYSGFPLSGVRVTVDLAVSRSLVWWRNYSRPVSFYSDEVTTGADGFFTVVVPAEILKNAPIQQGVYTAAFTALSATGESQDASLRFMTGSRYSIDAAVSDNYDISRPVSLNVRVVDYNDSVVSVPVNYRLVSGNDTVSSGILSGLNSIVDFSAVKSGRYDLVFSLDDNALADVVSEKVVLYRPTDKYSPVPDELFWTPETGQLKVAKGGKTQWLYATGFDAHILVTLTDSKGLIEQKWVNAPAGMHTLPISLPSGVDNARLSIFYVGNYESGSIDLNVIVAEPRPAIKFEVETFRDHLVPGSEETWTFRVRNEKGSGESAAIILDMYNQALDALAVQSWRFNPASGYTPEFFIRVPSLSSWSNAYISAGYPKQLKCTDVADPHFETWNLGFGSRMFYRFSMSAQRNSAMKTMAFDAGGVDEIMVAEEAESDMAVATNADAVDAEPMIRGTGGFSSGELKESVTVSSSEGHLPAESSPFTYRDSETPLAFFRPMLKTDSDGRLSFSFTVPNANTTWKFNALAFTDKLLTATESATVIANKPIMVQPNLPRFLRTGDHALILASVMNNSDTVQTVHAVVEIFDPMSGNVTDIFTSDDLIEVAGSVTVSATVSVPVDSPFIGYRVKASTADFADGEQSLIPVESSTTPVIETLSFYLQPDEADYSMRLPSMPSDARVTLQFCENPAWYVVTALPGLLDLEPSTANQAAASIFSAAIADGLLKSNPVIAEALREWQQSDRSDSTLVSMLERNADLKIVLLSATPWMMDARNDTERMTRLSLLFDSKQIKTVYSTSIALLKRLERNGAGWAWYDKCTQPSQWATENVLLMMGRLKKLGYLPANNDLAAMVDRAVSWIDKEIVKEYTRYPDGDYSLYTYLRTLYPDIEQSVAARAVSDVMTQRIIKDWKKGSVYQKAVDTQILVSRNYRSVAGQIIESLRQYAETSPEKGMWWPSLDNMTVWSMGKIGTTAMVLDAFSAVDPESADIDRIRQWLILQKEAADWGSSVAATEVITSILSSSGRWIAPAQGVDVRVGEHSVVPDKVERITGYFRTDISAMNPSGATLSIVKPGDAPSWGAVYCQYSDLMTDVEASGCAELSVTKKLLLINSTPDGVNTSDVAAPLVTGDKVRVQLTLKVERDLDYVAIVDDRPACFEPVEQLPQPIFIEGIYFYRENRNSATRIFIDHLPKGSYILNYDVWVNNAGDYASGIATVQSQYAPQFTAHSAGSMIKVEPMNNN